MRVHLKDIVSVGCVVALILAGLCLAAATESSVDIRVFRFAPGRMEVKAGSRVMWTNRDDITHTVTSGTPESPDGLFEQRLKARAPRPPSSSRTPGSIRTFAIAPLDARRNPRQLIPNAGGRNDAEVNDGEVCVP